MKIHIVFHNEPERADYPSVPLATFSRLETAKKHADSLALNRDRMGVSSESVFFTVVSMPILSSVDDVSL